MESWWSAWRMVQQRQEQLLELAETLSGQRRARAGGSRVCSPAVWRRALDRMGRGLVSWGTGLRAPAGGERSRREPRRR
jgi:hypothetical protein